MYMIPKFNYGFIVRLYCNANLCIDVTDNRHNYASVNVLMVAA